MESPRIPFSPRADMVTNVCGANFSGGRAHQSESGCDWGSIQESPQRDSEDHSPSKFSCFHFFWTCPSLDEWMGRRCNFLRRLCRSRRCGRTPSGSAQVAGDWGTLSRISCCYLLFPRPCTDGTPGKMVGWRCAMDCGCDRRSGDDRACNVPLGDVWRLAHRVER